MRDKIIDDLQKKINEQENKINLLIHQRDSSRSQREVIRKQRDNARYHLDFYKYLSSENASLPQIDNKTTIQEKFNNFSDAIKNNDCLDLKFNFFDFLLANKFFNDAKKILDEVKISHPLNDHIQVRNLRLYMKMLQYNEAFNIVDDLIKSEYIPIRIEAYKAKLDILFINKDLSNARKEAIASIDQLPAYSQDILIKYFYNVVKSHGHLTQKYIDRLEDGDNLLDDLLKKHHKSILMREKIKITMLLNKPYNIDHVNLANKLLLTDVQNSDAAKQNYLHLYNNISYYSDDKNLKSMLTHPPIENPIGTYLSNHYKQYSIADKKTKEINIAILFSGQVRDFHSRSFNIKSSKKVNIIPIYNVWENRGHRIPDNTVISHYERIFPKELCQWIVKHNIWGDRLYDRYPSLLKHLKNVHAVTKEDIHHDSIKNNFDTKKTIISIESEENIDSKLLKNISDNRWVLQINQLKMFYKMYQSQKLLEDNFQLSHFDFIIRARPDLDIDIDLDIIEKNIRPGCLFLDVFRQDDCGDRVAIGRPETIKIYNDMWSLLPKYYNGQKYPMLPRPQAHSPLYYHLYSAGIQVAKSYGLKVGAMRSMQLSKEQLFEIIKKDFSHSSDALDQELKESLMQNTLSTLEQ